MRNNPFKLTLSYIVIQISYIIHTFSSFLICQLLETTLNENQGLMIRLYLSIRRYMINCQQVISYFFEYYAVKIYHLCIIAFFTPI